MQKKLYVGGLPPEVAAIEVIEFFNAIMISRRLIRAGLEGTHHPHHPPSPQACQ